MEKILKWIDHNRFIVIAPICALLIWIAAIGCVPETESPTQPGRFVNAAELETDFSVWQKQQEIVMVRFEAGRADIEKQQQQWSDFQKILLELASGNVADLSGLLKLLFTGGLIGAVGDNIRKRGLIAGLKKNK